MPRPATRREPPIVFKYPALVEIRRPRFEPFASVRQLDLEKLADTELAEIELGYVKTECCQQLVKAIIRKGMVTEVQIKPCDEAPRTKPSPELKKLIDTALKRAARGQPRPPKFPMTIPAVMRDVISVITCVQVCIWGWCIACCRGPAGDIFCGRVTVDTTSGPYPE